MPPSGESLNVGCSLGPQHTNAGCSWGSQHTYVDTPVTAPQIKKRDFSLCPLPISAPTALTVPQSLPVVLGGTLTHSSILVLEINRSIFVKVLLGNLIGIESISIFLE